MLGSKQQADSVSKWLVNEVKHLAAKQLHICFQLVETINGKKESEF